MNIRQDSRGTWILEDANGIVLAAAPTETEIRAYARTRETSIYQQLKDAGVPLDNHESDLYAKLTDKSRAILRDAGNWTFSLFISQIDGALWYDIPFAYEPFWDRRRA